MGLFRKGEPGIVENIHCSIYENNQAPVCVFTWQTLQHLVMSVKT